MRNLPVNTQTVIGIATKQSLRNKDRHGPIAFAMTNVTLALILFVGFLIAGLAVTAPTALAQEDLSALVLECDPGLISLPPVKTRVPIQYARVRSTAMRDLNGELGALYLEALYETVEQPDGSTEEVLVENQFIIYLPGDADLMAASGAYFALDKINEVRLP